MSVLHRKLKRQKGLVFTGNLKTNLARICDKIQEFEAKYEEHDGLGKFSVLDLIRATLKVRKP